MLTKRSTEKGAHLITNAYKKEMYSRLFKPIEDTLLLIGQSPFELSFLIFKARKTKGNLLLAYPSGMKCRDVRWTVLDRLV